MDAEHRHELKKNDLANLIKNFPALVEKNWKVLIYIAIVIVVVVASYLYHNRKVDVVSEKKLAFTQLATALPQMKSRIVQARGQDIDLSSSLLKIADDMAASKDQADTSDMAAMACIKRADALRMELHYRAGTVTQQDVEMQTAQAKESYNEALEKKPSNPSLSALATLGLGLCEEEIGNFDGAKEIYKKIIETPTFEGSVAAAAAKNRYNTINNFKERLVFKPAPAVVADPNAPAQIAPDTNNISLPSQEKNEPNL